MASIMDLSDEDLLARMEKLVAGATGRRPGRLFEHGSALDSTGHPALAVDRYRGALRAGLSGYLRRRATIQLASSLRNLGEVDESVTLLTAELDADSNDLDDAVRAFLALALNQRRPRTRGGLRGTVRAGTAPRPLQPFAGNYAAELA